jgi:polyphosphate kinase 2 (PPK2 family)
MKAKSLTDRFRARPGQTVSLAGFDPADRLAQKDKTVAREKTAHYVRRLRDLQCLLYAEGRCSLLIFRQALDAGGEDGTIGISPEEPLKRFKRRIDHPARWRKISESDDTERQSWPAYSATFEEAFSRCSTREAPWYLIPSDHKRVRNRLV